jgi:hypothetical protein
MNVRRVAVSSTDWLDDLITLEVVTDNLQGVQGHGVMNKRAIFVAGWCDAVAWHVHVRKKRDEQFPRLSCELNSEVLEITRSGEVVLAKLA